MHCSCTQQHDAANNNVNKYTASIALLELQLAAVHILQTRGNAAVCTMTAHCNASCLQQSTSAVAGAYTLLETA
jgi:hypothetical protein